MRSQPLEDVVSHWSKLIENFSTSTEEFYEAVEKGLDRRQLPDGGVSRVTWAEGGVLSPNRDYLRIHGSGMAFDLCAAPFGTGFFFSWWLTRKRPEAAGLWVLAFTVGTWLIYWCLGKAAGFLFRGPDTWLLTLVLASPLVLLAFSLFVLLGVVGILARWGIQNPGEVMLTVPGIGWLYERWFSPLTFYRLDTAAMFRTTVHAAVLEVIDDLTTQKGLRALAPEERKPLFDRLAA